MILNGIRVINDKVLVDILAIIIPTLTSIIGFITTYLVAKKQISKELENEKKRTVLGNSKEILSYCSKMIDFKWYESENCLEEMKELMNIVIAYGSKETIKILSIYQQYNYNHVFVGGEATTEETIELIAFPCLLLTQVKYDITGEVIDCSDFLKIRLNDYETKEGFKESFTTHINKQIDILGLNKDFKI